MLPLPIGVEGVDLLLLVWTLFVSMTVHDISEQVGRIKPNLHG